MYGLNIHLKSFKLNPSLASGNDKVRVSITTIPEQNKEAFVIEARQMKCVHHFFTVNVTEKTEKIIFVFRKISFLQDPIIASTIVHSKDFPAGKSNSTEMNTFPIFEPIEQGRSNRRVIGDMQVQISLTSAFPTFKSKENNQKAQKTQGYSKVNNYSKINGQNQRGYRSIFYNEDFN